MKLVKLRNKTSETITITQVRGLSIAPGEVKPVHPATVTHPAVSPYIPGSLEIVGDGAVVPKPKVGDVKKAEPKAPEAPPSNDTDNAPANEETETSDDEPNAVDETQSGDSDETIGDLRDVFVSAPGITEGNVDSLLEFYKSIDELASASEADLIELGVSKSYAKKVLQWAASQE